VLDTRTLEVRNYRVPYDVSSLAMEIRKAGMSEETAQALLTGRSIRSIMEEETRSKKGCAGMDIENIRSSSHKYGEPSEHSMKVSELSLKIFDALRSLHHMEGEWRELLEAGALLHDIGWANGAKGHNKSSLRYILNDQDMILTSRQRNIIGSLARYHRKRLPRNDDFHLAALGTEDRERTLMLASILRVADGLDASHWAMVRSIEVKDSPEETVITCATDMQPILETESFEKKKDLFEVVFGKPLRLEWKLEN